MSIREEPPACGGRRSLLAGHRFRRAAAGFLFVLLVALFPRVAPEAAAREDEPPSWGGSVLDGLGRGIPGVEVLAYSDSRGPFSPSPGIFRTDERGRFRLSGLAPGPHILALSKPGYEVLLAQINTLWISRLTLTLIPGPSPGTAPAAALRQNSMDWVLRSPRTDLLKELGPGQPVPIAAAAPGEDGGPAPAEPDGGEGNLAARLPFNGEVQQWFITDPNLGGTGGEAVSSSGRTTALKLDGDLFGRGNWRVGGILGSVSSEGGPARAVAGARDEDAGRLRIAMDYNLTPEDSVRFAARYDRDSFYADSLMAPGTPGAQEVRTLGYQAGWTRQLDQESGLEMRVGFLQAMGRIPQETPVPNPGTGPGTRLADRRWNVGANYGFNLSSEHRVSVRAATGIYDCGDREEGLVLTPIQPDLSVADAGRRGWSVSLSGEDAWKISEPLRLILGLDYLRADSATGFSAVVPRVGARRESGRSRVEGQVLFRLGAPVSRGAGEATGPDPSPLSENAVGYRAEVLHRLGGTWTVSGHVERNPAGAQAVEEWADLRGPWDSGGLLLVDPAAQTEEVGVLVSKRLKGVEGTVGTDQGRVRGMVADRLDGAPIQWSGQGEVRYLTLKATASVPRTDTEIRFDYRRLDGLEPPLPSGDPRQALRMDLMVLQQIPVLTRRLPADWRVLFAYQSLVRDPSGSTDPAGDGVPERIRRLSGGVGVRF